MSIITLLRAQFRQRKGAWISVFILSFIASLAVSFSISSSIRLKKRAKESADFSNIGDVLYYYYDQLPSQQDRDQAEALDEVEEVRYIEQICPIRISDVNFNGEESTAFVRFQAYPTGDLRFPIFNESLNGFLDDFPVPDRGEVYLPVSYESEYDLEIGDPVSITADQVKKDYKVAGFIESILQIKMINYGIRYVYMNPTDYEDLEKAMADYPQDLYKTAEVQVMRSKTTEGLSEEEFFKMLGEETNLSDASEMRIAKGDILSISTQMSNIYITFLLIFAALLYILALIVIQFHVNSSLEEEYRNLGTLKAVGCQNVVLQKVYMFFFSSAVFMALVFGFLFGGWLMHFSQSFFLDVNSLLIKNQLAVQPVLMIMALIFLTCLAFVWFKMRKIGKISPLRALSGGRAAHYYSSFGQVPLAPQSLSIRLALRQLFFGLKQYLSALIVIASMMFFVLTVSSVITAMEPDRMMADYYGFDFDVQVFYKDETKRDEVEEELRKISEIRDSYGLSFRVLDYEGVSAGIFIVEKPENFSALIEGQAPKYDNEIALTRIMADKMEIRIGDTITIKMNDRSEDFLVTGTYQSLNNLGRTFAMLPGGIQRLVPDFKVMDVNYLLDDRLMASKVSEHLYEKFPGDIEVVNAEDIRSSMRDMNKNSDRMTALVTAVSVIFVLISCYMVATKIFLRERIEYGIYKSIGMRAGRLRRIFTLRFLLIAVVGALLGFLLYKLFGDRLISTLFISIGISEFEGNLTTTAKILPAAFISAVFTATAWLISAKIKRVQARELMVE